jgi:hypothetical protein
VIANRKISDLTSIIFVAKTEKSIFQHLSKNRTRAKTKNQPNGGRNSPGCRCCGAGRGRPSAAGRARRGRSGARRPCRTAAAATAARAGAAACRLATAPGATTAAAAEAEPSARDDEHHPRPRLQPAAVAAAVPTAAAAVPSVQERCATARPREQARLSITNTQQA